MHACSDGKVSVPWQLLFMELKGKKKKGCDDFTAEGQWGS